MALLEVTGIESGYGAMKILWGMDLAVQPGETVLLLGANSAGKTTLLRTIIGLLPAWTGAIRFEDEQIEHLSPDQRIRRGIAYMSEQGVFATLTIEENIRLGGYFLSGAEVRRRSTRLFELFPDLAKKRRDVAASLSGGQRKMLGIAKVLVSEPKLLLMDEPSSGLAPRSAMARRCSLPSKMSHFCRSQIAAISSMAAACGSPERASSSNRAVRCGRPISVFRPQMPA